MCLAYVEMVLVLQLPFFYFFRRYFECFQPVGKVVQDTLQEGLVGQFRFGERDGEAKEAGLPEAGPRID